jgi:hypothetical protein
MSTNANLQNFSDKTNFLLIILRWNEKNLVKEYS